MKYSRIFAIMPLIEVNVDKNRLKLETQLSNGISHKGG